MMIASAMLALLMAGGTAWPQSAPQQPALDVQEGVQEQPTTQPPRPPDQAAPDAAPDNPGLVHEMGRLFDKIMPTSPSQTLDDFNSRAKDAAKSTGDALSRLARPGSMVSGRMICPVAGGTPDCKAAADKLCQSKGYKEGKSLNGDAAETCSPKVMIPGRQRKPDDCRTDNYVTAALCQ